MTWDGNLSIDTSRSIDTCHYINLSISVHQYQGKDIERLIDISKIADGIYFGNIYFLAKLCTYVFTYTSETKRVNKRDSHGVTRDRHGHAVTITPATLFGRGVTDIAPFGKGCHAFRFFFLPSLSSLFS